MSFEYTTDNLSGAIPRRHAPMVKELKVLFKRLFMEEPFPGGALSRREQQLITLQIIIAVSLYASVVYLVLTNETFWAGVDRYHEAIGLSVPMMRILTGILLLMPIACAAIAYLFKRIGTKS